ncbi:MAG: hypothetical protein ACPG3Y_06905, partial [Cycloclasticus pugetii]
MKQTCILILGMHRSGTSALSGTLNLLDVYLGTELMKPMEQNAKGFYENTHLYKVNEKLLKQMNSRWDDDFYTESKLNAVEDTTELEEILKQEFQYSQLFAIKDPRLTYLFPIYTKALTNMGVDIKVIIPFRNPLEVADSLKTRNQFSQEKGLLLWAYHFLLSEKLSRGMPRAFTHFDELVQSPQTVIKQIDQKLKLDLNSKYGTKKDQIADFLTPGLKHHNIALDNLSEKVPKPIRDIVSLVPNLNETELDAKFDELRQQLFDNQSLFYNGDILKSMQELEQAKQGLQAKDQELEQVKQGLQAKDQELEQTKQGLQAKDKELEQAKQGLQAKDKELEQTKQGLQAKDKELEQAKQGLQAKDRQLEESKQELQAKDKELEQTKQGLQAK